MQVWVIILNIDDLNGSVDGQIIEDIKIRNCISHVKNRSGRDGKTGNKSHARGHYKSGCDNILHIISGEYFKSSHCSQVSP